LWSGYLLRKLKRRHAAKSGWPLNGQRGDKGMTKVRDLHKKWMKNSKYKTEYEKLAPEFELALTIIEARTKAGLTQAKLEGDFP